MLEPASREGFRMNVLATGTLAFAFASTIGIASAQTPAARMEDDVRRAKIAAGLDWAGTFLRLCIPPPAQPPRAGAAATGAPARPPAKATWYAEPAMLGSDGMTVSVGEPSVQIVTMPGHTPGTLSFLFEVRDNGKPLRVAYVGGTAIPFNADAGYYDGYIASSRGKWRRPPPIS